MEQQTAAVQRVKVARSELEALEAGVVKEVTTRATKVDAAEVVPVEVMVETEVVSLEVRAEVTVVEETALESR